MKYNFLYLLMILLILFLLFGCSVPGTGSSGGSSSGGGGSTLSTRSGGVILPLTVGNTWIHNWTAVYVNIVFTFFMHFYVDCLF